MRQWAACRRIKIGVGVGTFLGEAGNLVENDFIAWRGGARVLYVEVLPPSWRVDVENGRKLLVIDDPVDSEPLANSGRRRQVTEAKLKVGESAIWRAFSVAKP